MKRVTLWGFLLFTAAASFAADTQRYIVATKRPVRASTVGALTQELRDPAQRRVTSFDIVNAFAADLTAEEVAELRQSPEVRWIEPNVSRRLMTVVTPGSQMVPYGVTQLRAPQTWTARRSPVVVNVVVVDAGVDWTHPELAPAWAGGYNVLEPEKGPTDAIGHGTHVAGTIAAADNNFGVIGVAPNVRLWGVKAVNDRGEGTMEDVIKAIEWTVQKKKALGGRWVVNMSLGGEESSEVEREAFAKAAAEGLVLVAASGNGSRTDAVAPVSFPAAYESVIAVGAINDQRVLATFSNQGPELDFVAAGVRVVSTVLAGRSLVSYVRAGDRVALTKPLIGAKTGTISGQYIYCGLGAAEDITPAVQGKIALIKRGGEAFATKTRRALDAGAIAVVIFNHNDSPITFTLYDPQDPTTRDFQWPIAVAMELADGEALAAKGSGPMTIALDPDDYDDKNGTSMATPHVAGAVAMLWSLAPDLSASRIYSALATTAIDLGDPGFDQKYGHGMVDVFAAAKMIAPETFNPSGRTTGRRVLTRGRKTN